MKKLTPKQEEFCQQYLIDLNATQAAMRAGYSKRGATVQGSNLLANPKVKKRISELAGKRSERTQITVDDVVRELWKIASASNIGDIFTQSKGRFILRSDIPPEALELVQEIAQGEDTVKVKQYSKLEALCRLLEHLSPSKAATGEDEEAKMQPPPAVTFFEKDARIRDPESEQEEGEA